MFRNPAVDAVLVILVVLLIFGPKRIPQIMGELGRGMREFKDAITGNSKQEESAERPEITPATPSPDPVAGAGADTPARPPEPQSAQGGSERRS
jgi:sec-independent protein translocase protein TatA